MHKHIYAYTYVNLHMYRLIEDTYIKPLLAEARFSKGGIATSSIIDELAEPEKQLLMSLCTILILSTNTFSWWAGYIHDTYSPIVAVKEGQNYEPGTIYCYDKWYRLSSNKHTSHLLNFTEVDAYIPPYWIRVSTGYKAGENHLFPGFGPPHLSAPPPTTTNNNNNNNTSSTGGSVVVQGKDQADTSYIPYTFYINLYKRPDRKLQIEQELRRMGIHRYIYVTVYTTLYTRVHMNACRRLYVYFANILYALLSVLCDVICIPLTVLCIAIYIMLYNIIHMYTPFLLLSLSFERIEAVTHMYGAMGCTLSHIRVCILCVYCI